MKNERLVQILNDCCNDVTFSLNGVNCGVIPTVKDSQRSFSAWYGESNMVFSNVEDLMNSRFWGGTSLNERNIEVDFRAY